MSKTVSFKVIVDDSGSFKDIAIDAEDLKEAIAGVQDEAKKMSGSPALSSGLKQIAGRFLSVTAAVTAVVGTIKSAVSTIATFERANSTLASVLGTTIGDIKELTQSAMDLGRQTEFTATNVTELQTALARLGFTQSQIMDMQEGVLKFASAVGTDLASAADFTGSALRAFGLDASDTKALLDVMAASTSKSALDFSKLQTSISIVAPIAKAFGLDAKQTASFLGVLANNGYDASSAATALRNILLNLADSNGKLAQGIGHSAKTFDEIISAFKELEARGIDVSSVLEMTDKRSAGAAQTLISSAEAVRSLNEQLTTCEGSLEAMYTTMTDNLEGSVKNLSSAWEGLMLKFSNSSGIIKSVVDELTTLTNKVADMVRTGSDNHATEMGQGLMASRWRMAQNDDDIKKIGEELEDEIAQQQSAIQKRETEIDRIVGAAARRRARNELKIEKNKLEMLLAARKDYYDRLAWENGSYGTSGLTDNPVLPVSTISGPNLSGGIKSLADDLQKYSDSVERAVLANNSLGSANDNLSTRLQVMKSGITALINKYGTEDERIQDLIRDYRTLTKIGEPLEKLGDITPAHSSNSLERPTQEVQEFVSACSETEAAQQSLSALSSAFGSLSSVVGESAGAWLDWIGNLLSAIAQAIPAFAQLTAAETTQATANTAAAVTGGAASVASIPYVGPVLAIAAAASIIAALANIPKFASGAIAYGPTLGLFGEYPGASNNPEVVAPLDKLQGLIGGADTGSAELKFRIEGDDLVTLYNKRMRKLYRG